MASSDEVLKIRCIFSSEPDKKDGFLCTLSINERCFSFWVTYTSNTFHTDTELEIETSKGTKQIIKGMSNQFISPILKIMTDAFCENSNNVIEFDLSNFNISNLEERLRLRMTSFVRWFHNYRINNLYR